jgi:hypothetical protein
MQQETLSCPCLEHQIQAQSFNSTHLCFPQYQTAFPDTHYANSQGQSLELFLALRMVKKSQWR